MEFISGPIKEYKDNKSKQNFLLWKVVIGKPYIMTEDEYNKSKNDPDPNNQPKAFLKRGYDSIQIIDENYA